MEQQTENALLAVQQQAIAREMARIAGEKDFGELLQEITQYEVQTANIVVQSDEQEKMAVESLGAVRTTKKQVEALRKAYTLFPLRLKQTIDGMFKQLGGQCDRVEKRLLEPIQGYRRERERQYQEQLAREQERISAMQADDGEVVPEVTPPPSNTTKANGTTFFEKEVLQFEIEDEMKLVRAAISDAKANEKVPSGIVRIDEAALRKLVREEVMTEKQWKAKGVRVWKEKKAVVKA